MRVPIRVRQFPRFVRQAFERRQVQRRPESRRPTFHLCFFSCRSYFAYLYCSLHSLVRHAGNISFKVIVFSDEEMPLSEAQVATLLELVPDGRVLPWPKSMGWGATQIDSIWRAYGLAAGQADDGDVIARVDSDVFFFNDRIFRLVEKCDADLVGDGHFVNFRYCQGGCYFFRASAVRRIRALLEREPMERLVEEADVAVEDVVAYHLAQRAGLKVWLLWFMMFPDELHNAGGLTAWQRWKYSCAHFVMKNKSAMLDAYVSEVLKGELPDDYRRALNVG